MDGNRVHSIRKRRRVERKRPSAHQRREVRISGHDVGAWDRIRFQPLATIPADDETYEKNDLIRTCEMAGFPKRSQKPSAK